MGRGFSNFWGAIAAWLCLAPVAFARARLSIPSTLAPASAAPAHYIANLSVFLIWITGGIFLVVGGLLTFAPFKFRACKADPSPGPTRVYRSAEIDLAWTVIPVWCWCSFSHERASGGELSDESLGPIAAMAPFVVQSLSPDRVKEMASDSQGDFPSSLGVSPRCSL